jgi:hypothetical protein
MLGTILGGLGGILGFAGQQQTNAANIEIAQAANRASAEQAREQMAFQERMRGTQYQTAIQDMQRAGLNPMLAYSQGGAGTPTGAMGQVSTAKVGNAIGSALQGYQAMSMNNADIDLKEATTKGTTAQTIKTEADTIKTAADIGYVLENTKLNTQQTKNLEVMLNRLQQEIVNLRASEKLTTAQTKNVQENIAPSVDPYWYRDIKKQVRRFKEGYKANPSLVSPANAAENIYKSGKDWAKQKYQQYFGGQK